MPAIDRLLAAWKAAGDITDPLESLKDCIRAIELHQSTFARTYAAVIAHLSREGIHRQTAVSLADHWLLHSDFLLVALPDPFDIVIGNPPFVRTELIPNALMSEYRSRYSTIYDRADLYIPFIERSLRSLKKNGTLGFICADRWMKNRYGGLLRAFVAERFRVKVYIDMTDIRAFHADVIAYPAITIITNEKPGPTRVSYRPPIERGKLKSLTATLTAERLPHDTTGVHELFAVMPGTAPWVFESSNRTRLVRRLEYSFPTIENAGCKIGIGVATGADKAYIDLMDRLDVEPGRKLPLAMTGDIISGTVEWRGYGVINPFKDGGGLVSLKEYPRLKRHLERHMEEIASRHCAQKTPANWYRTIDRITPALAAKPKLLIPDIKGEAQIVYEEGKLYPHHNLYFITSDEWELRALQAVLLSGIARLFISIYSTQMRGGYLRFQAQYLRRIRVPYWKDVPLQLRQELKKAAENRDLVSCNRATFKLYGLTQDEKVALGGNAKENNA